MMVPIIPVIGEIRANGMSTTSPKMAIPKANGTEYMKNSIIYQKLAYEEEVAYRIKSNTKIGILNKIVDQEQNGRAAAPTKINDHQAYAHCVGNNKL